MKGSVILLFVGLVGSAIAAPQLDLEDNEPTPYSYAYGVSDSETGDVKEHKETVSDSGITEGEYRWLQPNGFFRVTRYTSDDGGYRAVVSEEPGEIVDNYYTNSLIPTVRSLSSQGNQLVFSSPASRNPVITNLPLGNQQVFSNSNARSQRVFGSLESGNQQFFNSPNLGSQQAFSNSNSINPRIFNSLPTGNQPSSNVLSENRDLSLLSGNRDISNTKSLQDQTFTATPGFQNQRFTTFQLQDNRRPQTLQPLRFTSGQSFQNQGLINLQTFQNQRNIIDGGVIDGGIINGRIIDVNSRNSGPGSRQLVPTANGNTKSTGSTPNSNSFGNTANDGPQKESSVVLASRANRLSV